MTISKPKVKPTNEELTVILDKDFLSINDIYIELELAPNQNELFKVLMVHKFHFVDCNFIDIDLSGSKWFFCCFERVGFEKCKLGGSTFNVCKFLDSRFNNDIFREGTVYFLGKKEANHQQTQCLKCEFDNLVYFNCDLYDAYFRDCEMKSVSFESCNLQGAYFYETDFLDLNIIKSNISSSKFSSSSLSLSNLINCEVNDQTEFQYLFFNENANKFSYLKAHLLYNNVYKLFKTQGYNEKASEYFWLSREYERKSADEFKKKLWLNVQYFLWGYGEKPKHVIISSFAIILLFSIFHFFNGIVQANVKTNIDTNSILGILKQYAKCFYFSVITFTTLGYGDITPSNEFGMLLSSFEAIFGVVFIAIGTATIYKKISKD